MSGKLCIVAGEGELPLELFAAARRQGREAVILAIAGQADPDRLSEFPHEWFELTELGDFVDINRRHGVEEMILGGDFQPWHLYTREPDDWLAQRMPDILGRARRGENEVVAFLITEFEKEGFRVVSPRAVAGDLFPSEGVLGRYSPDEEAHRDIALGLEAAKAIGKLDIGQAIVVQRGVILAVEGVEGTDQLIYRTRSLQKGGPGAILVKVPKPQQEIRADPPTIGPVTVLAAAESGFKGIAIEAEGTIVIDRTASVEIADANGLFLTAVRAAV